MIKLKLTKKAVIEAAKQFCKQESAIYRTEYFGVTDGKAIGTAVEHRFQKFLSAHFDLEIGNSAIGLDLPSIDTDIKVTSARQPQSSCPYRDSKQKIYGLGYNLLLFVYNKTDDPFNKKGKLNFVSCAFIEKNRTADYQTTYGIHNILKNRGNSDDVFAFLADRNIPADEVTLYNMARDIMQNPPQIGYLTISNALQWRLQYGRIVSLDKKVSGITLIV